MPGSRAVMAGLEALCTRESSKELANRALGKPNWDSPDECFGGRDDANAIGHPGMIPLSGPTGKWLEIDGARAKSTQRAQQAQFMQMTKASLK
jgi:hypothetical protein